MKLEILNATVTIKNEATGYKTSLDELVNTFKHIYLNQILTFKR